MKIRGITVGTTMKRPDFKQTDPKKSDYIKNNPVPAITEESEDKIVKVKGGKFVLDDIPGYSLGISMDTSTYIMTVELKDEKGNVVSKGTVDLPLESMVVGGYESEGKIFLELKNGSVVSFSLGDFVGGLTPSIGENGNWFVGKTDTGVKANGTSPTLSLASIPNGVKGTRIYINDVNGLKSFDVKDGKDGLDATPVVPLFANDISECIDTTKPYVLPDGFIYAHMLTEIIIPGGKNYTNIANPTSADWLPNSRLGSSGVSEETNGSIVTNYIPCKKDDVIRIQGLNIGMLVGDTNARVHWLDANKVIIGNNYPAQSANGFTITDGNVVISAYDWSYTVGKNADGSYLSYADNIAYIRFCGKLENTANDVIITVNEEIAETEPSVSKEYRWTNTGHAFVPADYDATVAELLEKTNQLELDVYELKQNGGGTDDEKETDTIPEYWEEHLSNKIARIKELQSAGGKDCFSFISICDMHAEQNLGQVTGLLSRKVMDECSIKFALALGDITTRGSSETVEKLNESFDLAFSILKPILGDTLLAQGNHDGAYNDADGDVYAANLSNAEIYDTMFRKTGLVGNVHFCDDGMGYYIDDTASRVRYVILNPHNKLGTSTNYFNTYRYGQAQFDLMVEALTTIPKDDWGIIFASHIPPVTKIDRHGDGIFEADMTDAIPEQTLLRNLVEAFINRSTSFSGNYGNSGAWDYVSLANIDFSGAKGHFIGYFAGHLHADCLFSGDVYNFPVITSRCDSHNENVFSDNGTNVDEQLRDERVKGTTTEQSFDVFTINKSERKIYATKIGAGADREIGY